MGTKLEKIKFMETLFDKGLNLEVLIKTNRFKGKFKTAVQDMDDDYIYIDAPIVDGDFLILPHMSEFEGSFVNVYGKFVLRSVVYNKQSTNNKLITIKKPEYMYLVQQRSFFRIEIRQKVGLKRLRIDKRGDKIILNKEFFNASVIDLSGGGSKINECMRLQEGDILEYELSSIIPGLSPIIGKVVKIYEDRLAYGIEFLSIKETDQDQIVRYGLEKQIKAGRSK
jgi:c-di-GMP-binding flagellar brake protein YcgR